jgi:hypothetical protein
VWLFPDQQKSCTTWVRWSVHDQLYVQAASSGGCARSTTAHQHASTATGTCVHQQRVVTTLLVATAEGACRLCSQTQSVAGHAVAIEALSRPSATGSWCMSCLVGHWSQYRACTACRSNCICSTTNGGSTLKTQWPGGCPFTSLAGVVCVRAYASVGLCACQLPNTLY